MSVKTIAKCIWSHKARLKTCYVAWKGFVLDNVIKIVTE